MYVRRLQEYTVSVCMYLCRKLAGSPYLASFRNKHRILLYQSPVAKTAFVRNIDPLIHIEYDEVIPAIVTSYATTYEVYVCIMWTGVCQGYAAACVHGAQVRRPIIPG